MKNPHYQPTVATLLKRIVVDAKQFVTYVLSFRKLRERFMVKPLLIRDGSLCCFFRAAERTHPYLGTFGKATVLNFDVVLDSIVESSPQLPIFENLGFANINDAFEPRLGK